MKQSNYSCTRAWCRRLVLALMLCAPASWAQWTLDGAESGINFISIKNASVAEIHSFGSVQGSIGKDGAIELEIDLGSVATGIEIRDERMREVLFETVKFPTASVTATVSPDILDAVTAGGAMTTQLQVTVSLHGVQKSLMITVRAVGQAGGELHVFTPGPVVVNAADFGLGAGVAALQEIAGLQSISTAVPVTVNLVFNRSSD